MMFKVKCIKTNVNVFCVLDHKLPADSGGAIIGGAIGALILLVIVVGVVLVVLYKKRTIGRFAI